jgi:hypothetical protein
MPRRVWGVAASAVLGLASLLGCQSSGVFDRAAFRSAKYPYTIRYADPEERALLSSDWVVENYYADAAGKPTTSKSGRDYRKDREIELASGRTTTRTFDVYDVLLVHRASDAVIWLRSIPLSPRQASLDLRVAAEQYAEGLSGSGFYATDLGHRRVESQTYASHMLSGRPVTVAGLDAYEATLEVANVDQLKLDPASRAAMIRVVFVRTPFTAESHGVDSEKLPVMWMVGYANNPTDFEAQSPDFVRFLGLIDANGSHGFTVLPPVQPPAPQPPAPVPPPPPATWTVPPAASSAAPPAASPASPAPPPPPP